MIEQTHKSVDERQIYDSVYAQYKAETTVCRVSCHDIKKARQNVKGVIRTFDIPSLTGARVLDVGCGLGYFAEALREQGAQVSAVDTSPVAIQIVREFFAKVNAQVASFPEDFDEKRIFDIIWACDFSLLNTFDVEFIYSEFIQKSLRLLAEGGSLIVGWHSNFGGTMGNSNWAHWPLEMITRLTEKAGLSGPRVVNIPTNILSNGIIYFSRFLKRSIPIYFFLRI